MKNKMLFLTCMLIGSVGSITAMSGTINERPDSERKPGQEIHIGAQVFIEPGQTAEEIDLWFRLLKENNMTVCRIRMFESYMRKSDGTWDFGLFDMAFRSAEKYGIKIFGTFFPLTDKTDIGGFKFPRNDAHLESIAEYIKQLTTHFSRFKSLHGWVLINEPGVGGKLPSTEYTSKKYIEWKMTHPQKELTDKGFPILMDVSDQAFLLDYNTWFLNWIAAEVRKYDSIHEIHVNNHAIFQNCAEYNFPEWRKFLTSLGGSAHASWHFGFFSRPQYAMAMLANSEIIRSGAGNIPWFMTELQGGNNTYSGLMPLCPTKEEIAQWLWIVIATEGKGGIFWTLNPRSSGIEAGEWALLDFQNRPSDRMQSASEVARTINQNKEIIENIKLVESGINVLYVRESFWAENKMTGGLEETYEARRTGAVMKSALGYFEAVTQMGINTNLKAFEEFDFNKSDFSGTAIILAHQISLPNRYAAILEDFVKKGGKLIIDGLTAFFDENLHNTMKTGFVFEGLFGGNISEFKMVENIFPLNLENFSLPAHLWRGYIFPKSGISIATYEGQAIALRNKVGMGEVLWIPSPVGLGSRISNDNTPLIRLLNDELKQSIENNVPIKFKNPQKQILMRTLKSGSSYLTVIVSKMKNPLLLEVDFKDKLSKSLVLFANKAGYVKERTVYISPEETMVIEWR